MELCSLTCLKPIFQLIFVNTKKSNFGYPIHRIFISKNNKNVFFSRDDPEEEYLILSTKPKVENHDISKSTFYIQRSQQYYIFVNNAEFIHCYSLFLYLLNSIFILLRIFDDLKLLRFLMDNGYLFHKIHKKNTKCFVFYNQSW